MDTRFWNAPGLDGALNGALYAYKRLRQYLNQAPFRLVPLRLRFLGSWWFAAHTVHGFWALVDSRFLPVSAQWLRAKESVEKYTLAVDAYRECKDDIERGNLN
jgi:hypothetical protein